jgi:hypothetical protein
MLGRTAFALALSSEASEAFMEGVEAKIEWRINEDCLNGISERDVRAGRTSFELLVGAFSCLISWPATIRSCRLVERFPVLRIDE